MGAAGTVDAHQHFLPDSICRVERQLREGVLHHGDVISGGVRAGVTRPQQHRDGFTGAVLAVVDECAQRMETEPSLERRGGPFLLGMRGDQGGIDVEDQRMRFVDGMVGSRCAGSGPGVGAGGGAGPVDRGQCGVGVGGQPADQARDGRVGGHRTEDFRVGS